MTTDKLAAIVAAAQDDIDLNKMAGMAKVRANWETNGIAYKQEGGSYEVVYYQNGDEECGVGRVYELDDAEFIANAPRTIIALVERIRELEAQRDALQAGGMEAGRGHTR